MIKELETSEYELWDKLVANSSQGTLFHKSYWLNASGMRFRIYGYFRGDELFAGIPITYDVSKFGIRKATHPLLTPYLGIIFKDTNAKYVTRISDEKGIIREFAQKIKNDFDSIAISFPLYFIDLQPFMWEGFSSSVQYTYQIDLSSISEVWDNMESGHRNHIRKSEKDGIYIENNVIFDEAFSLVEKTFERQRKNVEFKSTAYKYNEVLCKKGQCRSFLAKNKEGESIAVIYIVWDEKRSYQLLAGYDSQKTHSGASAACIWSAIKFTKDELGLNQYDFEGSKIEPIEQFFRKFGGTLTPYYSVFWMKPYIKAISYAKKFLKLD
jgi:hypothetical protein